VIEDVMRIQDTQRNAVDFDNGRSAEGLPPIRKKVQSKACEGVDQLDQQFRRARLRQVKMRDEKFVCRRLTYGVEIGGHEIHVFGGGGSGAITTYRMQVKTDGHTSGQGDPRGVDVRHQPAYTLVPEF
jgi:hypothetical protein